MKRRHWLLNVLLASIKISNMKNLLLFISCLSLEISYAQVATTSTITMSRNDLIKTTTSFYYYYQEKANTDAEKLKSQGKTVAQTVAAMVGLGYSASAVAGATKI